MPGVLAHAQPGFGVTWWYPEVWAIIFAFSTIYLYVVGPYRDGLQPRPAADQKSALFFGLSMAALALSEATPIHYISEKFLFSVHMFQHVVLTMVFAPLFLRGIPTWLADHLLSNRWLYVIVGRITHPVVAALVFNGINALWHLPYFYEAVLLHHWIHIIQHVVLVFTALMLWWVIVSPSRKLPRLPYGAQTVYIFIVLVLQLPVFAPIIFAEVTFYDFYVAAPEWWGVDALSDQQMAGAIMQIGGISVLLAFLGRSFFRWVAEETGVVGKDRAVR